ncbi:putative signal recognition particle 14kD protein [Lyophyllum shimeji]|uniref:Signal recognition particle subunit SRP14 n=1 Tax=Lyophyllum shimeji TaxID=47721 RepID=A0A9P3PZ13_LYOSH|nr:putative signal recognition particle 14kD protein [Lyophyllum shimeji]
MQLVDNDTFLSQLTTLFNDSKEKGTIWLTHKRLSYDGEDATMADGESAEDTREYPCLLRVTDGGSNKFSTKVEPGQLEKFHAAYGALLKASMTTLRKRDKKREKTRAEEAAKRRKKMTEAVVVDGPKRGSGRRKRQRQMKAALKQQESQQRFKERGERARRAQTS